MNDIPRNRTFSNQPSGEAALDDPDNVVQAKLLAAITHQPGALFFLGDCHATQGDGEIVGTGIETCFEVEVRLTVEKNRKLVWPRGENATDIFSVGNARPLDQALQHATTDMFNWLTSDYGLSPQAASHLMGQVVRYDVGNVFDPAFTMVCRIGKKWLPKRRGA